MKSGVVSWYSYGREGEAGGRGHVRIQDLCNGGGEAQATFC